MQEVWFPATTGRIKTQPRDRGETGRYAHAALGAAEANFKFISLDKVLLKTDPGEKS